MIDASKFWEGVEAISEIVEVWPDWKKNGSALMSIKADTERFAKKLERIPEQIRVMSGVLDIAERKNMVTKRIDGKLYQVVPCGEVLKKGDLFRDSYSGELTNTGWPGEPAHLDGAYYRPIEEKKTAPKPETVTIEISRETAEYYRSLSATCPVTLEVKGACKKALRPNVPSTNYLKHIAKVYHRSKVSDLAKWALHVLEHGYEPESTYD